MASVGLVRYRPARLDGRAVRQIVVFSLTAHVVEDIITVYGARVEGGTALSPPPTRC